MDAVKLKNSCICGNTLPYAECCGPHAKATVSPEDPSGRREFRRDLHDLYMYLFPLRNLYQAYWERLSQEEYPHHLLMADPDYGRAVMANFFWDYSVQFSDARPILRAARDVEEKNLRLANDFRQWSLAPLWIWEVLESGPARALVRMAGSEKTLEVEHAGELPDAGDLFAGRILPHRGRWHAHPAVLAFPAGAGEAARDRLRAASRGLGVKSGAGLRPDVQCDEWRRHGAVMLGLWRETVYDARVGLPARTMASPQSFRLPARRDTPRRLRAGGATPLDAVRFEIRHRALTLARLEAEAGGALLVTLLDEAYRPFVLHWLADHLDAPVGEAWERGDAPSDPAGMEFGAWLAWASAVRPELNGESPLEAIRHDFGRRRVQALLSGMSLKEGELSALRRHLGL